MNDLLLAIDQGTSGCKITIFDVNGQVIASTTKYYETNYLSEGYVEQNCEQWWEVIVEGIKEILVNNKINSEYIKGIGVDGISWSCIPINREGKVLYPTMIWLDRRATKEAGWMKDILGEKKLVELCGNPVDACYTTPKILWLKNNKPDVYKNTYKFLQSNSFIVYRLTNVISQDYSQGYGLHFFNIRTGKYDVNVAKELRLSIELFPSLYQSHEIVGGITNNVAKLTGLKEGTPVVAGGLDAACCTLGAGVINPGQTQEQGGQAGGMSIALDKPIIHRKLILGYHVVPNMWLLQGGTNGGGGTLNWFNREFGYIEKEEANKRNTNPFVIMSEEAESIEVGSGGIIFLPYMKGERSPLWNEKAKGVYYGLTYDKTRKHMIRATMEGVAYALQHNLETAYEVDAKVNTLRSVGGSSNSNIWTQIKADVTGCKIEVPYSDYATTLGTAMLAGVGVGIYKNFNDAVSKCVKIKRTHIPNTDNFNKYRYLYKQYLKLSNLMQENMFV